MRVVVVFDLDVLAPEAVFAACQAASFVAEEVSAGRWQVSKDHHGSAPRPIGTGRSLGSAAGEHLARTTPEPAPEPPVTP
jgi:hypothetical protein